MIVKNSLPSFYLITPDFEGDLNHYLNALENSLKNGINLVQLRSKELAINEYKKLANEVVKLVHHYKGKLILNGSPDLLNEIEADGIHFPSAQYMSLNHRPIGSNYIMSVACHNDEQVMHANKIKTDVAVICPIFSTPSSPQGIPIGWEKFAEMIKNVDFAVYALGGLKTEDYQQAHQLGAHGIAAKRAFWNLKENIEPKA